MEIKDTDIKYLRLLAKDFPTSQAAQAEIINLNSILNLPKGTEHFFSDIHGESEAFEHILRNASGTIKLRIDELFPELTEKLHLLEDILRKIMTEKQLPVYDRKVEKVSYMDGCKVYLDGGWVIVRFSGTEPRVRIFAEAETEEEAKRLVKQMADFTGLDWRE